MSDDELRTTTAGFAELMLQLPLYDWQAKALLPLESATGPNGVRQNIAVCTPNGSGKDERLIPTAAYWWLFMHPRGRVVITSKSDNQLSSQTILNLDLHWRKFGWKEPVQSPRYTLVTPTGGSLIAYVTNEGARSEGHHKTDESPLLIIVNEAKSVEAPIFDGIFRCTPNAFLLVSSPGGREGVFYDCFKKDVAQWHTTQVGLADCPHIPKEKIDFIRNRFGPDDPYTRSTLHGEFMEQQEGEFLCCTDREYDSCIDFPPPHKPGFRYGFFDFAEGRAENTFVVRNGNKYELRDAWRDTNEDAVVGRCIYLIHKEGLQQHQVGGDAAAKSILDKMASSGMAINRQNFGAKDKTGRYKSWSAKAWLEGCQKIRNREVILPNDDVTRAQVTNRKKIFLPDGRLSAEDKHDMLAKRGLASPDRGDGLFGCMDAPDTSLAVTPNNFFNWSSGGSQEESDLELIGVSVGR